MQIFFLGLWQQICWLLPCFLSQMDRLSELPATASPQFQLDWTLFRPYNGFCLILAIWLMFWNMKHDICFSLSVIEANCCKQKLCAKQNTASVLFFFVCLIVFVFVFSFFLSLNFELKCWKMQDRDFGNSRGARPIRQPTTQTFRNSIS